jgi:nucleoside-diphosphate-sugar epimerase
VIVPENQALVIVTGSSGFIGEAVCRAFVADGYAVVGFDRPETQQPQPGVTNVPCDVTAEDSVAQAVASVRRDFAEPIASVIHLAAYYDFSVAKAGAWVQDQIPGIEEPFIKSWMIDLADDHYALDISRARSLLAWSPRRNLREARPRMVTALESDPDAFYRLNKLQGEPPQPETATAAPRADTRRAT